MAEMICVCGESGSGKTSSLRNLKPEEVFIISTTGKRPGIPGAKRKYKEFNPKATTKEEIGNFYTTTSVDKLEVMLNLIDKQMTWVKVVVVDDYQYFMAFEAMDRAKEKGYEKFTEMAQHAYQVMKNGMNMRDDLFFVVSTHSENTGDRINQYYKIKTLGKMLDSVITLEGLFTYVLFTTIVRNESGGNDYKFITNSDGTCTAKTPMGLFDTHLIDNDLNFVIDRIKEYNEG